MLTAYAVAMTVFAFVALMGALGIPPLSLIFDRGSFIFTGKDRSMEPAILGALAISGLKPGRHLTGSGAIRRIFFRRSIIVNFVSPKVAELLGNPTSGLAFVSRNPYKEAFEVAAFLRAVGVDATVIRGEVVETDIPAGCLAFVRTDAFPGTVLVYRRYFWKLPKPLPWSQEA